jgi:dipeptidyl aminopeptidase/acylaminoacyl peptidase
MPNYKLVLFPHGGPHSRSTSGFNFTAEVFAAHDYAVFQPNFRGSAGYGRAFVDADRGGFGGGVMHDILRGIEQLVAAKRIDPNRQFVYGISYGGFMTCWPVGRTHQSRAAVAQNDVTDLTVMCDLSDIQSWNLEGVLGRPPKQRENTAPEREDVR